MDKKEKNEEIHSRREFFKRATQKVLPIFAFSTIGAIIPIITTSATTACRDGGCYNTCQGSAAYSGSSYRSSGTVCDRNNCTNGCAGGCRTTCTGSCTGDCTGRCTNTCKGGCTGSCTGTCQTTCTGSCQNTCTGCSGNCSRTCTGCEGRCDDVCTGCRGTCQYTAK